MIELVVTLLVLGGSLVVFYPVLAGPETPIRPAGGKAANRRATPELDDEHQELIERKRRLLRNLKELDAERAAGRTGESDYASLRERDQAEAARVMQQLEKLEADLKAGRRAGKPGAEAPPAVPPRRRAARAAAWAGGIMAFGAAIAFTMSRAITERQPGGTITGTIPGDGGAGAPAGGAPPPIMPKPDPARLSELERVVRSDSTNLKALLEAGHLYLAEQRFDDAARVTMKALRINRASPEAFAHLGVLMFAEASSHSEEARQLETQTARQTGREADATARRARAQADSGRAALHAAMEAVNHAVELDSLLPDGWLFKGMISMAGLQDPKAAAEAWEHYLKVAPKDADTTRIAAMVRGLKGR